MAGETLSIVSLGLWHHVRVFREVVESIQQSCLYAAEQDDIGWKGQYEGRACLKDLRDLDFVDRPPL